MAGILFIICIPTVEEEALILAKVQSDLAAKSPIKTPLTTKDLRYGTFEKRGFLGKQQATKETLEEGIFRRKNSSAVHELSVSSVPVSPSYKQRDVEASLPKAKSVTGRDDGDGLRRGLLGSSTKSLLAASSSSSDGKSRGTTCEEADLDLPPDAPMFDVVRAVISLTRIENAVWTEGNSRKKWQVIFSVEASPRNDNIVRILNEWGIGDRAGSFVTILPCTLYKNAAENQSEAADKQTSASEFAQQEEQQNGWDRFVSSVTARYNVAQLVEKVRAMAEFTFDFISLLIVASLVALFGLVENNSLFLAASMLISPLMGPIVAATFGTVIKDRKLQIFGVVNELYGIAIVTLVGFIGGFIFCLVDSRFGDDGNGMTNEMVSRSLIHSVIVGIFVAIPSGIAVAIGILGDNFGSLAGVAISASLLPPAVNTGLMFAFAVIYKIFESDKERFGTLIKSSMYSEHQSVELAVMGAISMCVTLTNVITIYIMGILFLKIKEVAPNVPANVRQFWRHDIKIARDYNKNHTEESNNTSLRKTLEDEIAGYEGFNEEISDRAELLRKLERHFASSHQKTWSPTTCNLTYYPAEGRRPSIQELFNGQTQNQLSVFYPHQLTFQNQNSRMNDHVLRRASIATTTTKPRIKIFHQLNKIHEQPSATPSPPHRTVTLIEPENAYHHHFHPVGGPSGAAPATDKHVGFAHRSSVGSLKKFVVVPVPDAAAKNPAVANSSAGGERALHKATEKSQEEDQK